MHTTALLDRLREGGLLLTITHDPALARALSGDVALMRAGRIVERGEVQALLRAPTSDYGRALVDAEPSAWPRRMAPETDETLLSEGVTVARGGRALVRDLDLAIHAGERIAVTGTSGSGKSSLLDVLTGLLPPLVGRVTRAPGMGRHAVQKLYQDPPAAFAPSLPLRTALRDVERRYRVPSGRIAALLDRLGVPPLILDRPPGAVSGGELQRVALARILALSPTVILADEPTSRLDLMTQKRLMDPLGETADETGAAVVLVTHDPDVAGRWADRPVAVG